MKRISSIRLILAASLAVMLAAGVYVSAQQSASAMATAANQFLAALNPEQRALATFALDDEERTHWNFVPDEAFPRNGLPLKTMSSSQRKLAHELIKTGLSQRGYLTYSQIMELETVLKGVEDQEARARRNEPNGGGRRFVRDPLLYRISIFGTPGAASMWGWRLEGHHVSLHFTVAGGRLVNAAPTFAGTNPAEVRDGRQKGLRILGEQEDAARAFVTSLSPEQQKTAIFEATAPGDIVTGNTIKVDPLEPVGIQAKALSAEARIQLLEVVKTFSGLMHEDIASVRMGRIYSAGIDTLWFGWAGSLERGAPHYFRIQGPTFLIEFDNTQNGGNHVHSVWRDYTGDFGADILREHLTAEHGATPAAQN